MLTLDGDIVRSGVERAVATVSARSAVTVLLLEGDAEVRALYARALSAEWTVRPAGTGEDCLSLFDADVDVCVLDRNAPGRSGDEVLSQLRTEESTVPVALVSARVPSYDVASLGADAYVTKPVTRDPLRRLVRDLLVVGSHDPHHRAVLRLAAALGTLEGARPATELAESDRYAALRRSFEAASAGAPDATPSPEEWRATMRSLN